jgi:uncharacterized protein YxjI
MRQKILALGHDFWVKDAEGRDVYYIDNKLFALRKTYSILDAHNREILKVQHKPLHIHRTMELEQDGKVVASVQKNLISPLLDRWTIEVPGGQNLTAQGDLFDHEYTIQGNGGTLAHISKQWFAIRESYGIDIADGANVPLMIGIALAIDDIMDSIHAEQAKSHDSQ